MKLKTIKTKKYTLIKLYLLKYQIHKKVTNFNIFAQIDSLEINVRHVFKLILLYHLKNKKILFIGFPHTLSNSVLKNSIHSFVPKMFWSEYLNKKNKVRSRQLRQTKNRQSLNSIIKTYDLIVFFNVNTEQSNIVTNFQSLKIPLVFLGNTISTTLMPGIYNLPLSLSQAPVKQFFYYLLYSILKIKAGKNDYTFSRQIK